MISPSPLLAEALAMLLNQFMHSKGTLQSHLRGPRSMGTADKRCNAAVLSLRPTTIQPPRMYVHESPRRGGDYRLGPSKSRCLGCSPGLPVESHYSPTPFYVLHLDSAHLLSPVAPSST